ncbi:MAG: adenylosuccinate synthase [Bacteroidota bacterium]|nr:adenylosuccinate synthase [Bacteroidota bacterium]
MDVLVGLQWGDEGKGKIIDILSPKYKIIARFQGGPNAGHTLVINDKKFIFHTLPSGIIQPNTINILGSGMVINPVTLQEEIDLLKKENISYENRIYISQNAHLILPTHKLLDKYFELLKEEKKIGSTLRGIGPTYQDKIARVGLRFADVLSIDFKEKYLSLKSKHLNVLSDFQYDTRQLIKEEEEWFEAIEFLRSFKITDTELYLNEQENKGTKILAEGAQGSLLDINFGTYPYVTSSNTLSSGACNGLGIPPQKIDKVFGVFKAYTTRVGEGPFATELFDEDGEKLRKNGHEFGSTTGRPRRCGWLDIPALNYTAMLNGVTDLIITKADVLSGFDKIKTCAGYQNINGVELSYPDIYNSTDIQPKHIEHHGWAKDVSSIKNFEELPLEFKNYISFIEENTQKRISIVSVGPERLQTIMR